jgi:hypothetical protein
MSEGRVGPIQAAEGSKEYPRLAKDGSVVVKDQAIDDSLRGEIFYASGAVAGVDHAATLTTTAPAALYNPVGSEVDLEIIAVSMGYVSGTLGAGFLALAKSVESATQAAPTGTEVVARGSTKLSATGRGMRAVPLETVTLVAGATLVCPIMDIAPKLATSVVDTAPKIVPLAVPIIVPPGVAAVLNGICGAAGTSPRVVLGWFWKEHKKS